MAEIAVTLFGASYAAVSAVNIIIDEKITATFITVPFGLVSRPVQIITFPVSKAIEFSTRRYLMRAYDGSVYVYWTATNQYADPESTTPAATGSLTDIVIIEEIAMNDMGFYAHPLTVTLVESTATGIVEIPIESGSVLGGTLQYTIQADDGVDFQSLEGEVRFVAVNKAGTISIGTPSTVGTESVVCSTGTLSNATTLSTGTDKVTVKLNAVSSLTQTTLTAKWRLWWHGTATAVTPL